MGAEFLFMDDNARPHRANTVDECLQSEDITRMDWPAYSPDLNPIEHVWDMLDRRIATRQPPPTCLPELRRALLDEWCNIPQDQIDNLILSMPRRSTRRLLATDYVLLNHGQVTWTTPELAPPVLTTTLHQREDVSALDRFNVHRCPTRRVFSGTGLELMTRQASIRYPYPYYSAIVSIDIPKLHHFRRPNLVTWLPYGCFWKLTKKSVEL
ncbi:transposable element Tc3 transposase [Trichonephila clavipes]|nr:transposable element Tc3 transposase [Trichonephila clavipes]